ncbi:MAG: hypothetical protein HYV27_16365 [Candidatus Hydrogenedentes bacterium]|nr:hypothetical protein [Candidatus Hydrogenedentota bacterium]
MKSLRNIEYVGWGFFAVMMALCAGPGIYAGLYFTYDIMPMAGRIVLGLVLASVVAAVVTFIVNEALHRRNLRKFEKKSKEEKKEKKRRKKKGK